MRRPSRERAGTARWAAELGAFTRQHADGAVDVEDRGGGYLVLRARDAEGRLIHERHLFPGPRYPV